MGVPPEGILGSVRLEAQQRLALESQCGVQILPTCCPSYTACCCLSFVIDVTAIAIALSSQGRGVDY